MFFCHTSNSFCRYSYLLWGSAAQSFPIHKRPNTCQPGPRSSSRHTIKAKRHLVWRPSPLFSQKIQKALVKHWREQGIRIFTCLNDGAGVGKSYATASTASSIIKWDIATSRFRAHAEKCCWEPTQVGDLLGFTLNLKEGTCSIHVPPEYIAHLREQITLVSNWPAHLPFPWGRKGSQVLEGQPSSPQWLTNLGQQSKKRCHLIFRC